MDCPHLVSLWVCLLEIVLANLSDPAHCGQHHSQSDESWTVYEYRNSAEHEEGGRQESGRAGEWVGRTAGERVGGLAGMRSFLPALDCGWDVSISCCHDCSAVMTTDLECSVEWTLSLLNCFLSGYFMSATKMKAEHSVSLLKKEVKKFIQCLHRT